MYPLPSNPPDSFSTADPLFPSSHLFSARVSEHFDGAPGRPMGSYVMALAVQAMLHVCKESYPDPISLHVDFFNGVVGGSEVVIRVTENKRGKRLVFLEAMMVTRPKKAGERGVKVLGCQGIFGTLPEIGLKQALIKEMDVQQEMHRLGESENPYRYMFPGRPPVKGPVDKELVHRDNATWMGSHPQRTRTADKLANEAAKRGQVVSLDVNEGQQWVSHPDGREMDCLSAVFWSDGLPFNYGLRNWTGASIGRPFCQASTLSLSLHFFARPSGKLMRRSFLAGVMNEDESDGRLTDWEVKLWDERGATVVCLARQTALMMPVKGGGFKPKF